MFNFLFLSSSLLSLFFIYCSNSSKDDKALHFIHLAIFCKERDFIFIAIIFDFSIYSYAEYYTGIIFNFYVEGAKKSVISGGRCDKLFKHYGKDLEDIGFGLDIDVLASYCLSNHLIDVSHKKYLSISDKESFILEHKENISLREKGIIVSEVPFESKELALDYAKENGFDAVIEYKNNACTLWEVEKC
jgi:ATP phosphoribosyltransferase regulatory subunit